MPVLVRIPTPLRTLTKGSAEIQAKKTALKDGDEVSIVPAIAGG
jgi:hypothetical protein